MKIFKTEKVKETKQELRKPQLLFMNKRMYAISENGVNICTLIDFRDCGFPKGARTILEGGGYSTDWAKWDDEGRMTSLLEDFE